MKKALIILAILLVAMNIEAQDFYSAGYYKVTNGTIAALYKNNQRVYTAHYTNRTSKAIKVDCNSQKDVFWMVNHYNYPSNTLSFTEIRKNNQVYASTENHGEIHIYDMYCLEDTLYYAGYQLNENGVAIATVWKGEDFTTHWVLGDGLHASVIYDADVDKSTNIPYFCGYINDSIRKACVWEASQLLYTYEPTGYESVSNASEISVDNGFVYTNGYISYLFYGDEYDVPVIWKDNTKIYEATEYDFVDCLYAHQGDFYYTYYYPHGMFYAVYRNRSEILQLPLNQTGIQRICGDLDDIYMVGVLQGQGCIWKNFEVYLQPNNCYYICDMVVSHANVSIDEIDNNAFAVYPNPANNVLFVETQNLASLPTTTAYCITNMMGQTLLTGCINADCQQINIENLPTGMYFINIGEQTVKFVKQ